MQGLSFSDLALKITKELLFQLPLDNPNKPNPTLGGIYSSIKNVFISLAHARRTILVQQASDMLANMIKECDDIPKKVWLATIFNDSLYYFLVNRECGYSERDKRCHISKSSTGIDKEKLETYLKTADAVIQSISNENNDELKVLAQSIAKNIKFSRDQYYFLEHTKKHSINKLVNAKDRYTSFSYLMSKTGLFSEKPKFKPSNSAKYKIYDQVFTDLDSLCKGQFTPVPT